MLAAIFSPARPHRSLVKCHHRRWSSALPRALGIPTDFPIKGIVWAGGDLGCGAFCCRCQLARGGVAPALLRAPARGPSLLPGEEAGGFGADPVPAARCSVPVPGAPAGRQSSPGRGNVSNERLGRSLAFSAFAARMESFHAAVCDGGWGNRGWSRRSAGAEASPFPTLRLAMGRPSPRVPRLRPGLAGLACADGKSAGSAQPLGLGPSPQAGLAGVSLQVRIRKTPRSRGGWWRAEGKGTN